jgi:DNA primase
MANPGDFAATVKQQADIVRIVGEYVKLRKSGAQNFSGLCPFHQEKTPSFSVHAANQFFHCFGCNAGGDVFTFVQKIENITFPEAVRMVADKLGIPMPKVTYSSPEEARLAKHRGALLDIHERACAFFQEQLKRTEAARAREYLRSRGLNAETIAEFRIGFAPESGFLLRDSVRGQFDEDVMRDSGLFSWKDKDQSLVTSRESPDGSAATGTPTTDNRQPTTALYSKFRNRVMFPITTEQGKVIAFTGRTLATDDPAKRDGPKYLNSPETPIYSKSRVLFNLDRAKEAIRKLDYAILVEGQMDCIAVYSAGLRNVIASSGTAFTELQARLLGRFSKKVVVNFDPDTAGAAAAERSVALLVSEDFEIKVLTLETGFDPDLFIRMKGANAYVDALARSQKYFEYLIERARAMFPSPASESKQKALNYLLPHIQRVPSRIVRDELAVEVSHRLGIESSVLRQELRHVATSRSAGRITAHAVTQLTDAERVLIRALASHDLAEAALSAREGEDLGFDPARQAYYFLTQERLHEGFSSQNLIDALLSAHEQSLDPMVPLNGIDDKDRRLVASVLMEDHEELTPELVENAIRSLRKRAILRQLENLQHRLKEAERRNDSALSAQLLQERVRLRRAMSSTVETPGTPN